MPQLEHVSGGRTDLEVNLSFVRGDWNDHVFEHKHLAQEIKQIKFTSRLPDSNEPGYGDTKLEIPSDTMPEKWEISDGLARLKFYGPDTQDWVNSKKELSQVFDIQITLSDDTWYTRQRGSLTIFGDITRDDDTTLIPAQATLGQLNDQINAIGACQGCTWAVEPVSAAYSDLKVANAQIVDVGDNVMVGIWTYSVTAVDTTNNIISVSPALLQDVSQNQLISKV
jgi:hypothetical protein